MTSPHRLAPAPRPRRLPRPGAPRAVAALLAICAASSGGRAAAEPAPRPAAAPPPSPAPPAAAPEPLARARALYARGDFAEARALLLRAYAEAPRPELLFALGQVELQLGNTEAAIGYYERFLATDPSEHERSLAEQAIGAARMRMLAPPARPRAVAAPPPAPPVRVVHPPRWDDTGTLVATAGGLAIAGGAAIALYARHLVGDGSGTLSQYEARLARARELRWGGAGAAAAGALAVGIAVVRWRRSGRVELRAADAAGRGAAVAVRGAW